jgi:putative tricarboxylic transport membrane protein
VLALVLGPLAEEALRQTMTISRGSFGIFLDRPASLWIIGITIALLVLLPILGKIGSSAGKAERAGG